jgi:hypothetical protein
MNESITDSRKTEILQVKHYNNNYYHTIRKFKNIPIQCECGKTVKKENMRLHRKSPKHQLHVLSCIVNER